jgi:S1-C subfamily serine protease
MKTASDEPVVLTMGRADDNDLVVDHPSVSAHHAELHQVGPLRRIVDLSSVNGTFVNGRRVTSQVLNDGDAVHLGSTALEYSDGSLRIQPDEAAGREPFRVARKARHRAQQTMAPKSATKSSKKTPVVITGLAVAAVAMVLLAVGETGSDDPTPPPTTQPAPTTTVSSPPTSMAAPVPSSVPAQQALGQEPDWEQLARSVVDIWSPDCDWGGSGTIVLDGSYILTNAHLAIDMAGTGKKCDLIVGFTDRFTEPPDPDNYVPTETILFDTDLDLAVLRLIDLASGEPMIAKGRSPIDVQQLELKLGEEISALGYPGIGGLSITYSKGSVSGTINIPRDNEGGYGEFIKTTDLNLNHGNSGGAAFNSTGQFIGIPTAGFGAEVNCEDELCFTDGSSVGLIRPSSYAKELLARVPSS